MWPGFSLPPFILIMIERISYTVIFRIPYRKVSRPEYNGLKKFFPKGRKRDYPLHGKNPRDPDNQIIA
jgi:hypothetical protein